METGFLELSMRTDEFVGDFNYLSNTTMIVYYIIQIAEMTWYTLSFGAKFLFYTLL